MYMMQTTNLRKAENTVGTAYICAQKCVVFIPYHSVQYVKSLYQCSCIFVDHPRLIKIFASLQLLSMNSLFHEIITAQKL